MFLCLTLLASTPDIQAGENGKIPFQAVAELFDGFARLKDTDKLKFSVRISSKVPGEVKVPIKLTIQAQSGAIPLELSSHGEIVGFPASEQLRKENPHILSNQPKGSLRLQADLEARFNGHLTENLDWYRAALKQANAAVKAQAGLVAFAAPTFKTLCFDFGSATNATVRLQQGKSDQVLTADTAGVCQVGLDSSAKAGDGILVLSQAPAAITFQ